MTSLALSLGAFISGSLPMALFVTRAVTGTDIRQQGSGNVGAANAARSAGLKAGLVVLMLDMLKGIVPALIARALGLDSMGLACVAGAAVLGHDFSVFLQFRGGKGVATTLGVMLVLSPFATCLAVITYLLVLLIWRYSSLASLAALALLPVYIRLVHGDAYSIALASLLFFLAAAKHWQNIQRLSTGTEPKFGRNGS